MKKVTLLFVFILMLLVVSTASADGHLPVCELFEGVLYNCDGDEVLIFPWRSLPDVLELRQDQEVVLGLRWGACKKGLVNGFIPAARPDWLVDGEPLFGSSFDKAYYKEVRRHWGDVFADESGYFIEDCILKTDAIWFSYWTYPLGTLAPGDHPVELSYRVARPVRDGHDIDGDGKMDVFTGELVSGSLVIRVVE